MKLLKIYCEFLVVYMEGGTVLISFTSQLELNSNLLLY